ncbi:hypothetical protein [Actinomadura sp. DC4]|uniref:hypothetical protein n=1 Tax=Actinomadura sp. DC4 TaxID=3055069 RepID=UPI0025AF6080|nr:hypothetical protein [Actinomadura sp. DC4]MDN3358668.1 hypothetical protein [Actinomadura sp. DC4]
MTTVGGGKNRKSAGRPRRSPPDTGAEKEPEGDGPAQEHPSAIRRSWEVTPVTLGGRVVFRGLTPVPTPGVEFFASDVVTLAVNDSLRPAAHHRRPLRDPTAVATWLVVHP